MRESYLASPEGVRAELKKRGYNFLISRAYAIQLTKPNPTKRFAFSNAPYQEALGGCNHENYTHIMRWAIDDREAADQIERICTGAIQIPEIGPRQGGAPAVTEEIVEKLAQNRADAIASNTVAEIAALKTQLQQEIAELRKIKESAIVETKSKRGRPPGSKNKKKSASAEPELTEEQEAMLKTVNFGPPA